MVTAAGLAGGTLQGLAIGTQVAYVVAAVAINMAISFALGKILEPSYKDTRDNEGMQQVVKESVLPRRIIYGEAIVGGAYVYIETTGTDNETLTYIVAISGHPVDDILGVFINDDYVNVSGLADSPYDENNASNDLSTDWWVKAGLYGDAISDEKAYQVCSLHKNTGWGFADNQYVTDETRSEVIGDQYRAYNLHIDGRFEAIPSKWDVPDPTTLVRDTETGLYTNTGHKLTNCAYVAAHFIYKAEVWSNYPKLRYHVKGKRLYNPALDPNLVAYGADSSGTHDLNDPDTWEWSEDWTLCVLDYLINPHYGLGARASTNEAEIDNVLYNEIDWEECIYSYSKSSEIISNGLESGEEGFGTSPRYTVNGVFETDSTPVSIMESLLTSGAGSLIYSQGKYKIKVGAYKAPASASDIINEDMIVGDMTIQTHTPRADLFNKATGTFVNAYYNDSLTKGPDNKPEFVTDEFPIVSPIDSSGLNPYEVMDGESLIREFDFPFTIRAYEAQRLAKIQLERVRRGITISFNATLEVLKYSVGDTVYLEILSNSKYANEDFYNRLGLDDSVQLDPDSPQAPYYKQFKITSMEYNEDFTVNMILIEESEAIYDWNDGYASPDDGPLGHEAPITTPDWPVLDPTFILPSPYEPVVEVTTATGISTLVRFTTNLKASPNVEVLDRPYIERYILEYGIIDNPSQAVAADRVSVWQQAGTFAVSDTSLTVQGPLVIPDAYIDNSSDYDFRVRSVSFNGRGSNWVYHSEEVGDWSPAEPGTTVRYYILPTNGTAIRDGVGTLIVEAHEVTGAGDNLITSGNKKLYVGSNEVNVTNNFPTPSDGYTGYFDSGAISDSVVVELRDDTLGLTYDTITLVDIADGAPGEAPITAYITVIGPHSWADDGFGGSTPSDTSTQVEVNVVQAGNDIARTARTINKTTDPEQLLTDGGVATHSFGSNLNTGNITVSVDFDDWRSSIATVTFTYNDPDSPNDAILSVSQNIFVAFWQSRWYILPTDGTVIKNSEGTLTVQARRVSPTYGTDELVTGGSIKLFVGAEEVNTTNGYPSPSDGYTGTFDAGKINETVQVDLKHATSGTVYDSITLADITDGTAGVDSVYGYIESDNGLVWTKAADGGAWSPATLTTKLNCTFVQAGGDVARVAYLLTRDSNDGTITGSSTNHDGGDFNTGRVTISEIPSGLGTNEATIKFDYYDSPFSATVSETVFSVSGGSQGSAGADGVVVTVDPPSYGYVVISWDPSFNEDPHGPISVGQFTVMDGATDVTVDSATSYSVNTPWELNNLEVSVNSTTGEIFVASNTPGWNSEKETFTLTATYNGIDYNRTFTVRKLLKGKKPIEANLTSETITVPSDFDGTNYTLPSNPVSVFRVIDNGVDLTGDSSVTYGEYSPDTVDGLVIDVHTDPGNVYLDDPTPGWTGDSASFTLYATVDGDTYEKVYTITKSKAGNDGGDGDSIAVVNAYLRKATLPNTPSGDTLDEYNFTTKVLTPPSIAGGSSDDWSATVPAGSNPLYVISATAEINGTTGTDTTLSWSAPQILASDGVDGSDGLNNATVTLYHKNTSSVTPPTLFTGTFTYTFSTGVLSGGTLNGWSQDAPSISAGEYLWGSQATASSNTATDSVPNTDFNTPQVLGIGGTDGADALNTATVTLYNKNTSGVTPPSAFSGTFTYTFSTGVLSGGTLNGWSQDAPSLSAGEYLWARQAYASSTSPTDSVPTADFNTAQVVGIGGSDGTTGDTSVSLSIYSDATTGSAPTIPSPGTSTYNFVTSTLTINDANWNASPPSLTADGQKVYVVNTTVTAAPTETAASITWSSPATIYSQRIDGKVGWGHDMIFSTTSPTDSTVAWTSGTLKLVDGTEFGIPAGNTTSNMISPYTDLADSPIVRHYIYFDADIGSPYDLIVTPVMTDAVGTNKILIAVAEARSNTDQDAYFQVFGGAGGVKIAGDEIAANSIVANNIRSGNFDGVTFRGATFETRIPNTDGSSPVPTTPRAVMQSGDPYFGLYIYSDASPAPGDQLVFGVTEVEGTAQLQIQGGLAANTITNAEPFSPAGITALGEALGWATPTNPTGGIATRTTPTYVSIAQTEYELFDSTYPAYDTALSINSFTITLQDSDYSVTSTPPTAWVAPTWNIKLYYNDTPSFGGAVQVPSASWNVTGSVQLDAEEGEFIQWMSLNATRTLDFTPASPIGDGETIYYWVETTKTAGHSNTPRITNVRVSEAVSGDTAHTYAFETVTVTDTDAGYTWSETGSVVAASQTDTLTLVSGTNIDIDVDNTTSGSAIRISSTGGGGLTGTVANDQIVIGTGSSTVDSSGNLTFNGTILNTTYLQATSLGSTGDPGTDDAYFGGYGIIGSSSTAFYVSNFAGPVKLNYADSHGSSIKFETTSSGAKVTGDFVTTAGITSSGLTTTGDLNIDKNGTIQNWAAQTPEASHSVPHEMVVAWSGTYNRIYFAPKPESVADWGREFSYNFADAAQRWEFDAALKIGGMVISDGGGDTTFDTSTTNISLDIGGNGIKLRSGKWLRIQDSTNTDYVQFSHDGTDFNSAFTNTTDWNITGFSGGAGIVLTDGTFKIDSTAPLLAWQENDQAANSGYWTSYANSGVWNFGPSTDAGIVDVAMRFNRSAGSANGVEFLTKVTLDNLFINEATSSTTNVGGDGQIWVKTATPNQLWFTDDGDNAYPVATAAYRQFANQTLNMTTASVAQGCINAVWYKTNTSNYSLTLETSSNTNFPVGAQLTIYNAGSSGLLTINDQTTHTLYHMDGSSTTDVAGGCTVDPGGYATLIRESASISRIMGSGIST